jgi:hypothetical protein
MEAMNKRLILVANLFVGQPFWGNLLGANRETGHRAGFYVYIVPLILHINSKYTNKIELDIIESRCPQKILFCMTFIECCLALHLISENHKQKD